MSQHNLPRWPLRMHASRVLFWLLGWMNSERHEEYKHLLHENRRLRRAIRDHARSVRRLRSEF